jgi:hypothetical protein
LPPVSPRLRRDRRRARRARDLLASDVQELQEEARAVRAHGVAFGRQVVVHVAGLVRGRDGAVGQRDRPAPERLEQRGEGHRRTLPRRAAIRHAA